MQIYEIDGNNSNNISKDDIIELLLDNSRDMYQSMIREINYLWGIYYYGPKEADRYNILINIILKRGEVIYQFEDDDNCDLDTISPETIQRCRKYLNDNDISLYDGFIESAFSYKGKYIKDVMDEDFFFSSDYEEKVDLLRRIEEINYCISNVPNYNYKECLSEDIIKKIKMLRDGVLNIRWYNKDTPEDKDNIINKI
ncbi:MAG: hypothetical protein IKR19_08120 [Acholeplasmatales bacterium]|nr:hypothetical protein [Acholeplasmatales bacterium]